MSLGDEVPTGPRRIGVLIFDGVMLLDVSGPAEVFVAANREVPGAYQLDMLSISGGVIATSIGAGLTSQTVEGAGCFDTVLVPGSAAPATTFVVPELVTATVDLSRRSRRLVAVCTGAFVLAAAGLLDGRKATTHWKFTDSLARRYPRISVDDDAIYVRDGTRYSSAGASAGIDLALALVEEDLGCRVAEKIARDLLVYLQRRGGQSQISPRVARPESDSTIIQRVAEVVRSEPTAPHTVRSMAAEVNLSERQLTRLFRRELGTTPAAHVNTMRFEIACDQLKAGVGVADAAVAAGFASAETMRRTFVVRLGISPSAFARAARERTQAPGVVDSARVS